MKNIILLSLVLTLGTILLSTCRTPYFLVNEFESITKDHETIAILPFEVIFNGRIPEELTEEDILELEIAESQAFQIAFYDAVLRSTNRDKHPIRINIQPYRKTLNILEKNNIGFKKSWYMDGSELAKILGVDAIVSARIEKSHFFSDFESYSLDVSMQVINIITDFRFWPWLPFNTVNKEVFASYYLTAGQKNTLLWQIQYRTEADWRRSTKEILESIHSRAAKHFPYRIES